MAIALSPQARAACELGNIDFDHSDDGRVLALELPLSGGQKEKVVEAYAPCSNQSALWRQSFYNDLAIQTQSGYLRVILAVFIGASTSAEVEMHAR